MVPFSFSGEEMQLVDGRALFWPRKDALLVADLHLEKASFFARSGQMLPPYDSRETLERLAAAIRQTGARRVFALGDNFHDDEGANRLEPHARGMLDALTRAVDWTWITGNHDSRLVAPGHGACMEEITVGGIALRHRASSAEGAPEISGHYHPKLAVRARGRRITRPCTVLAAHKTKASRMILPAFGAMTGGMNAGDPAIVSAMQPADRIDALVPLTGKLLQYPLWRAAS
ncbi:MAG: ligase-associated DNA damage response endonuclease PdeM [Sphingomonadaceae bacterium]|nr:ligase-associated DNA damage response endonuclease PdeM [Sphingomonadaceae bacterium]